MHVLTGKCMHLLTILLFMNPDLQDFVIAVQTFVETSSVGEFGHRIHLLKAFNRELLQKGRMAISVQ